MERHKGEANTVQSSAASATEMGAGSVAKCLLARQALGPEFHPRHPCKKWMWWYTPHLGAGAEGLETGRSPDS